MIYDHQTKVTLFVHKYRRSLYDFRYSFEMLLYVPSLTYVLHVVLCDSVM